MREITITEEDFDKVISEVSDGVDVSVGILRDKLFGPPQWITDREPTEEDGNDAGYVSYPFPDSEGYDSRPYDEIPEGWPWMPVEYSDLFDSDNPAPNPFLNENKK